VLQAPEVLWCQARACILLGDILIDLQLDCMLQRTLSQYSGSTLYASV
jgi:hypothetical protein